MTLSYRNSRRSFPPALLLIAALSMLALGTVSCRMVTDPASSITIDKSDVGKCVKACNDEAKDRTKAEKELHKINIFLCKGSKGCQKQENARHDQAIDRIEAQRLQCIQECHHQGGASGGR